MKTVIFIDSHHLNKTEQDNNIRLDYLKLSDELTKGKLRIRTYVYDAKASHDDLTTPELQNLDYQKTTFLAAIDRLPKFEIKLGKLQNMGNNVWKQKGVDMQLGVDMVQLSANKVIDQAILIAADGDFVYAVEKAKDAGIITTLVTFPVDSISRELRKAVDEVVALDKATLEKCRFTPTPRNS